MVPNLEFPPPQDPRERILDTCVQLFMRLGIRSVTMDEVASRLGISKKTVYQHFADKRELVLQTMAHAIDTERNKCELIHTSTQNPLEELYHLFVMINQLLANLPPGLMFELKKYYPTAARLMLKFRREYVFNRIQENIRKGIADGIYRSDLDPETISILYIELPELIENPEIYPEPRFQVPKVHRQVGLHFLYGIVNEKGLQMLQAMQAQLDTPTH